MYKLIKNVFSKTDIDYLRAIVKQQEDLKLYDFRPDTGRISVNINSIKLEIVEKVQKIIQNIYGKDYEVQGFGFQRYNLEYGFPNLRPHLDDQGCQVVFDYQIESNKKWDLVVEGESIGLNDNDAVVFEGEKDAHWRNPVFFKPNEYVSMLNFNAIHNDHWTNFTKIDPIGPEQREKLKEYVKKKWASHYSF